MLLPANLLEQSELPALFRVHDGPSAERLENLRGFLGELALDLPGGDVPTPGDYQSVLAQIEERPDAAVIQTMMLRSLSQAVYAPENKGHFGLHYPAYAHFTSPIRRYPRPPSAPSDSPFNSLKHNQCATAAGRRRGRAREGTYLPLFARRYCDAWRAMLYDREACR